MVSGRTGLRAAMALLTGAVATSCGDASAPRFNPVDFLLADANGSWNNAAAAVMALAYAPASPIPVSANSCKPSFSTSAFVCPQREWNGLAYDLSFQLLDAASNPVSAYDARTVAAIRTMTAVSGTLVLDSTTIRIVASSADRTLSGLLTGDPTINGTESASFIHQIGSYVDTSWTTTVITGFKVPPRNVSPYPSGVIATSYYRTPPDSAAD